MANKLAFLNCEKHITTHDYFGYMSKGHHRCDLCAAKAICQHYADGENCVILERYAAKLSEALAEVPHLGEIDLPLIGELIRSHCTIMLLRIYYAVAGEFAIDGGKVTTHPVRQYENQTRNYILRVSDALGLSPEARRRMMRTGAEVFDIASRANQMQSKEGKGA